MREKQKELIHININVYIYIYIYTLLVVYIEKIFYKVIYEYINRININLNLLFSFTRIQFYMI